MKKLFLLILAPFVLLSTLSAQITQKEADSIVKQRLVGETKPYTVYAKNDVQSEGYTVITTTGETLELEYPCWVYFVKYEGETIGKYLIVKESNGNSLEINTKKDNGPNNLNKWRFVLFDDFCTYVNIKDIDQTIPFINKFLKSLSNDLSDEQKLQELATWLKSFPCIIFSTVSCQSCNGTNPPMSEINISFNDNGTFKRFSLAISMSSPLEAIGYHYLVPDNENYYYYSDKKIYLHEAKDKILLKFTKNTTIEQMENIINKDIFLQPMHDEYVYIFNDFRIVVLESKDGNPVPASSIVYFKTKQETVAVTYILGKDGYFSGIMDDFAIKLKSTTSYEQLQELAAENNCIVGEHFPYGPNTYMMHVLKVSHLNAILMSSLFYETGLFNSSSPNMIILNAFGKTY